MVLDLTYQPKGGSQRATDSSQEQTTRGFTSLHGNWIV